MELGIYEQLIPLGCAAICSTSFMGHTIALTMIKADVTKQIEIDNQIVGGLSHHFADVSKMMGLGKSARKN